MFGNIFDSFEETLDDFIDDPIGKALEIAAQPIIDSCDLLEGLTEGEFRERAALRLGADVVGGMAISEVIAAMSE